MRSKMEAGRLIITFPKRLQSIVLFVKYPQAGMMDNLNAGGGHSVVKLYQHFQKIFGGFAKKKPNTNTNHFFKATFPTCDPVLSRSQWYCLVKSRRTQEDLSPLQHDSLEKLGVGGGSGGGAKPLTCFSSQSFRKHIFKGLIDLLRI